MCSMFSNALVRFEDHPERIEECFIQFVSLFSVLISLYAVEPLNQGPTF